MAYTAIFICNNFLKRSFAENEPITFIRLLHLNYIAASRYVQRTGYDMFPNPFYATSDYGPIQDSVYGIFSCFGNNPITKYAKNAKGSAQEYNEDEDISLHMALEETWVGAKRHTTEELTALLIGEGSVADIANKHNSNIINPFDVHDDTTYHKAFGIA